MTNTLKINREAVVVFLSAIFLFFSNIWGYPITILDEAKNAEAAREMLLGSYLIPYFNDFLRTDKPPLHYVFMQLGYLIFGINELGARFFGAVFGVGFITYFFLFLKKYTTRNISRIAIFILLSSFFWVQEFHLAVPDPYFIALLCTSWLFFYSFYENNNHSKHKTSSKVFLYSFYIFVGLATLAKGPIAIGLTGLTVLLFLIFKKELNWQIFAKYKVILGVILILLIAAPWFIWVHHETNGSFTDGFFYHHNIKRFQQEIGGHGGIFLLTWAFVLLGLFPFGAFILQGMWHGWKFKKRNNLTPFAFIISAVVIMFFSISSTKLPNYTLPAMPFLAILIAGYFEELHQFKSSKKWWNYISVGLISLVSLAIPVAIYILFQNELIENYQIIYTGIAALVVGLGLFFVWNSFLNQNIQNWILSIGILWMTLGLIIFYLIYPKLSILEPVAQASGIIKNREVVVFENYDSAFNFNYKSTYQIFDNESDLIKFIQRNPNTLVLTKDRAIDGKAQIQEAFNIIFDEPSVFENYRTIILERKE